MLFKIISFGLISLLIISIWKLTAFPTEFETVKFDLNGTDYFLQLAKTPQQQMQGLMHRRTLASNEGMLFIFPKLERHFIWMKNTLIPLVVIWLDENEVVVGIKRLQPCRGDPCPVYGVDADSRYIIELSELPQGLYIGSRIKGLDHLN